MARDSQPDNPHIIFDASNQGFLNWQCINDSIMGGTSHSICTATSGGLVLDGFLVEESGGFVSCRSPLISPGLNLSQFKGLELSLEGHGRLLKFSLSCSSTLDRFTQFLPGRLRWVVEIPTNQTGLTNIQVPFESLLPNVRAKRAFYPLGFNPSSISQFQLLYSKFGTNGKLNKTFQPGRIQICLRSVCAYV